MTLDESIRFLSGEAEMAEGDGMPNTAAGFLEAMGYLKEYEHLRRVVNDFVTRWESKA